MTSRNLPSRSTRGKRMNQLVGDDALVDEEFWKMDLFKEDEEDEEYKSEAEEEDVIDADFDNPEEVESEEEVEVNKEKKEKKKMAYVDPKSKKAPPTRKRKAADRKQASQEEVEEGVQENDEDAEVVDKKKMKKRRERLDAPSSATSEEPSSSTRKSTRAVALQRNAEREKERAESEKKRTSRPKKKSPVVVRRITQEELLEEAKLTEQINTESLKYILSMEEEKKKVKEAPAIVGPVVTYYSKDGKTYMCFDELPPVLQHQSTPSCTLSSLSSTNTANTFSNTASTNTSSNNSSTPTRHICPFTGLPAKYKDPKTGIYYANLEAFKTLRIQHLQKEEAECNSKIVELASLLHESKRKKEELQGQLGY